MTGAPNDQLAVIIRTRLRQRQYRPGRLDAFVTHTGLVADPRSTGHPGLHPL